VQAWYQGGASLVDFTDSSNPVEIGYFDRGPVNATNLVLGGFWSTYWYNGHTYGGEIARGLDVLGLTPTEMLSANEIAAAREVEFDRLNVQSQPKIKWEPSFAVVRSFFDQLVRADALSRSQRRKIDRALDKAERAADRGRLSKAREELLDLARDLRGRELADLRDAVKDLAFTFPDDDSDSDSDSDSD
jgi:hypothetical protein